MGSRLFVRPGAEGQHHPGERKVSPSGGCAGPTSIRTINPPKRARAGVCCSLSPSHRRRVKGMRRTAFLLASTALAVLLSCGAALALNAVACEGGGKRCVGTDRPDLMKGTGGIDAIYGRDKGDTLKGFGDTDALLGQRGRTPSSAGRGRTS